MSKRVPDLESVLGAAARPASRRPAPVKTRTSGRAGTVPITIHVDPEIRQQLKVLAAEQQTTVHRLVCTGLNAVFAEHHKPEIAR